MRYQWDEEKNEENQRKHGGVTFKLAARVFEDPNLVLFKDRIDAETGEQRWCAVGIVPEYPSVLLIIHVYREVHNEEEIIRIISARKARHHDIRRASEYAAD